MVDAVYGSAWRYVLATPIRPLGDADLTEKVLLRQIRTRSR